MNPRTQKTLSLGLVALAGGGALVFALTRREAPPAPSAAPAETNAASNAPPAPASAAVWQPVDRMHLRDDFVGSAACTPCHAAEAAAYAKSHHALALVKATPEHVEAKLNGTSFTTPLGGTTRFAAKDGTFNVTSPNSAGKPETFTLAYAAGVSPLQQYVVATERGKLQTLGVSWDSRSPADGGGRFFHVYGPRGVAPTDELFFTNPAQNWNHVCADCHSTFVERGYDATTDRFDTRWSELTVGCEACHGPGAEHVRQAQAGVANVAYASSLSVRLEPSAPWAPSETGSPTPRTPDTTQVEVCAPCHSRREPIREGFIAGDAFLDAFEPELLEPGRYHADGQVEGEVYEWGSFLQSRMYAAGVRCSDCHEPHSATLRAEGNALCTRCHAPATFDAPSHSHHTGGKAPRCVDCHLPPATFMQIDERRDHSIRIPRPDLSVEFGTPNACNRCHAKQTPRWAADTLAHWFPAAPRRPHFVAALGRDRQGAVDAPRALAELAADTTAPAIARATALERLGHFPSKRSVAALRAALASPEPLIVYGAVLGASELPLAERAPLLFSVLEHPRRLVRIAAAKALAGVPAGELDGKARVLIESAFSEVEQSFLLGASRPDVLVAQSSFELSRGKVGLAEAALNAALKLAPCFAPAHLNLADLARARQDETSAVREIHAALACDPQNAFAYHALGLAEVRAGDKRAAVNDLKKAVALAPSDARFSYVLAVASADLGDVPEAVKVLEAALPTHGDDRELLQALAGYLRQLDRKEDAANVQAKLAKLLEE
jgi:predicted CXXCH cytochrome family protein